jgi:Cadherin-like/Secretion system C-terminal sorting domain/Proprotein convertase P-domain
VRLISPIGTDVLLWKDKCPSNVSFNFGMDDGASGPFGCPPPNNGLAYKPTAFLGVLNGESSQGTWTLRVKDNVINSGGTLSAFELEICSSVALNPPLIIVNNPLTLNAGTNAIIGDNLLKAEDINNGASALIFTLMSLPANGQLLVNNVVAAVGSQFSQADISNGGLRYYDYGFNLGQDVFNFSVTDGEGGLVSSTFKVQPTVGTHEPDAQLLFELMPNPATSMAILSLNQALTSDARVTLRNAAGQVVETGLLATGAYTFRMALNHLPKGIYTVSLENAKAITVKKLVVQ